MSYLNLLLDLTKERRSEITTSRILKYMLEKFPSCHYEFLAMLNCSANHENFDFLDEYPIYQKDNYGYVDLVLLNDSDQYAIYIENKPWDFSSLNHGFTEGDQLKRYAISLKEENFNKKILCLLTIEKNKEFLLYAAATAEHKGLPYDEASLKNYYTDNYGIDFVVITWEQILERFSVIKPEKATMKFLVKELKDYMFPSKPDLPRDIIKNLKIYKKKFPYFKELTYDANILLLKQNSGLKQCFKAGRRRKDCYFHHIESPVGRFHFGPNLGDYIRFCNLKPEHPLFINFWYDNKIFFLQKAQKYSLKPFTNDVLSKCGFTYTDYYRSWPIYAKLLEIDQTDDITPQKIVDAVMKNVNQVAEVYEKIVPIYRNELRKR
ncbi:MAG: PD-(D/E)XK nuclease family protein [Leptospirales bacterium]|nr:PD-(D/E)XK nuclease family protein [Leptospirales bacterium]